MHIRFSFLVAFFLGFAPSLMQATVLPVTSSADDGPGSLRQALRDALPGDTLFLSFTDTLFVDSTLQVEKSLVLLGAGPDSVVLSGRGAKRILQVDTLVTVWIQGMGFAGGNALRDSSDIYPGGGAIRNWGELTMKDCIFRDNEAGYGGAIENAGQDGHLALLKLERCTFTGNVADPPQDNPMLIPRAGGALFGTNLFGGSAKIQAFNCTFSGNRGGQAGGAIQIYQFQGDTTRSLECTHCTITDNESEGAGGVDVGEFGLTYYTNTLIAGNRGRARNPDVFGNLHSLGGLLVGKIELNTSIGYVPGPGDTLNADPRLSPLDYYGGLTPTHTLQCNSPAIDAGVTTPLNLDQRGVARVGPADIGAIERDDFLDVQVTRKSDGGAGSLRAAVLNACPGDTLDLGALVGTIRFGSEVVIDKDLSIFGNPGAVIWLNAAAATRIFVVDTGVSVHLRDLTLAHGRPELFGGGAILNRGNLKVERTTFFNNSAISGGAVANYGDGAPAHLEASNCTFSSNRATILDGGAVDNYYFTHPAEAVITHCTFYHNEAKKRGGAVYNQTQATVTLHNTLIGENTGEEGKNLYGTFSSQGHNLIGDDLDFTLNGGTNDLLNQAPLLGPLQYHGGSSYTHALMNGSPAIDAGDNTGIAATDQRGYARIFNGTTDIGAYEYDPATSLEEKPEPLVLLVYPNPNKGVFTVRLPQNQGKPAELKILDLLGKELHRQRFSSESYQVELPGLPAGVYVLQVKAGGGGAASQMLQIF